MHHSQAVNLHPFWFTWSTVFAKTAKGREEIIRRAAGLNVRERSVLIMLDGMKRLDRLLHALPKDELGRIVDHLAKHELIEVTAVEEQAPDLEAHSALNTFNTLNTAAQVTAESTTLTRPAFLCDPSKLREIKYFMTSTAQTYLGLLSADLIHRIERASDAPQLMAVVGQWYLALRDSKHGHRFASAYMENVLAALRGEEGDLLPKSS